MLVTTSLCKFLLVFQPALSLLKPPLSNKMSPIFGLTSPLCIYRHLLSASSPCNCCCANSCKVVRVFSSTILLRLLRHRLYHYYGLICHLHPLNKSLPFGLFLLSPLLFLQTRTRIKASPVKQTLQYRNPSVITFSRIRI